MKKNQKQTPAVGKRSAGFREETPYPGITKIYNQDGETHRLEVVATVSYIRYGHTGNQPVCNIQLTFLNKPADLYCEIQCWKASIGVVTGRMVSDDGAITTIGDGIQVGDTISATGSWNYEDPLRTADGSLVLNKEGNTVRKLTVVVNFQNQLTCTRHMRAWVPASTGAEARNDGKRKQPLPF